MHSHSRSSSIIHFSNQSQQSWYFSTRYSFPHHQEHGRCSISSECSTLFSKIIFREADIHSAILFSFFFFFLFYFAKNTSPETYPLHRFLSIWYHIVICTALQSWCWSILDFFGCQQKIIKQNKYSYSFFKWSLNIFSPCGEFTV